MDRTQLVTEAKQAGKNAKYNLQVIRKNPTKMFPGKIENAEAYLNMMISFSEVEIENARRLGRANSVSSFIKIITFIVPHYLREGSGNATTQLKK